MNLGELKESVKRAFGDESAVQITDADIVRWVSQGQEEIVRENEEILEARVTVDLVASQDEYPFPEDLLTLRSLKIKDSTQSVGYRLVNYMTLGQFELSVTTFSGISSTGLASYVYTTYENTIFLFPVPASDITDGMRLVYAKRPVMPVTDVDPLGLPLSYHMTLVKYCLVQAYELDENWEASANKVAQLQLDLNRQANRSKGEARAYYPTITVLPEDQNYEW